MTARRVRRLDLAQDRNSSNTASASMRVNAKRHGINIDRCVVRPKALRPSSEKCA
jgi:hypothetical protein